MSFCVLQALPSLETGGVERGTLEVAAALARAGHRSLAISAGGAMVKELEGSGSEHITLPIGQKGLGLLGTIPQLRSLIRSEGIDLIHVRSRLPAWVVHWVLRGLPATQRPALISTVHGAYSVNFYSRIMTCSDAVIAVSEFIRGYILQNWPSTPSERIHLICNGIDEAVVPRPPRSDWLSSWRRTHPELENMALVTLPGRITRRKGHEDFLHILRKLRDRGLPIHGLVAGAPEGHHRALLDRLKALTRELGIKETVSFIGQRDDMPEVLAHSDIALSLSQLPESFGRTVLEALAIGTPVVGYAHGGVKEILENVCPEGLAKPLSVEAATQRVAACLHKPFAIKRNHPYTLANMQNRTLELYGKILGRA
ncbi:MAG: glycosyltransferase family 4 protein [Candidatus Eutrophobiaceae bacterium]